MLLLRSLILCSIAACGWAVRWVPQEQFFCAKCADFTDDADSRCHYRNFIFFRHYGNRYVCHEGCVHIDGVVTDSNALNEAWRKRLTDTLKAQGALPEIRSQGPFITGSKSFPKPRVSEDGLSSMLEGQNVIIKLCANEISLDNDHYGCKEMELNGIMGTFCKCSGMIPVCNQYTTSELEQKIDKDSGRIPVDHGY